MFDDMDDWLIDRVFEPLAHKFQRLTGKTNFWLAKWGAAVSYIIFLVAGVYLMFVNFSMVPRILLSLALVFGAVSTVGAWFSASGLEDINSQSPKTMNAARYLRRTMRVLAFNEAAGGILLILAALNFIWLLVGMAVIASFALNFVSEYFLACTPLPPGTSKFREWLNSLLWKVNEALAPKPERVPSA